MAPTQAPGSHRIEGFDVVAPGLMPQTWSEPQAMGCATWLWMHSPMHREVPLHTLSTFLLPALKRQQFILALQGDRPVFYMAWALMDEAAERRYLSQPPVLMPEADWRCGDRMWVLDWVAPFGHTQALSRLVLRHLVPHACMRALSHHGDERGLRVLTFRGRGCPRDVAQRWWQDRPLATAPDVDRLQRQRSTLLAPQQGPHSGLAT